MEIWKESVNEDDDEVDAEMVIKTVDNIDASSKDEFWDTDIEDEEDVSNNAFDPVKDVRDRYVAACKEFDVVPVSYFIRNLPNVRMNLAHHGISEMGMKAVAFALMSNTHLTALELCDNALGNTGVKYLCELLLENYYISEIDISENNITCEGVLHLYSVLTMTDTVKRLAVRGNSLDCKSAIFLSEMIKQNTSLRQLDISHNLFGEESGLHLGPALAMNEYLTEVNLSWNHLRQKGAFAIAKSLEDNITLKKLNLSWNGFADDGMYVLSEALKLNSSLQFLDISSNRITHVGASHMQKGLKENEGLIILKMGLNPLQQGTAFILQGIKDNCNSTIQELDLTDVQVNAAFVTLLAGIQKTNPLLQVYHGGFSGCALPAAERPKPMKVLRDYIRKNQIRIFDIFNSLDKDKSLRISIAELVQGLQTAGVPLRVDELFELMRALDLNGDGEVDYKELVIGNKTMVREERSQIKKSKAKEERNKTLAKDLRPSTPVSPSPTMLMKGGRLSSSAKGSRPVTPNEPKSTVK